MEFEEQKQKQLGKEDKSHIGSWDKKISKLCNKLNKKKNYYTTSSCAGRVVLLKGGFDKIENAFLFRTHEKVTFKELKEAIASINYPSLVEFQQTPCILHVACKTLEDAQDLVNKAKESGWKHSGIMSTAKRFMVELHSTEKLEFPLMIEGKLLVNDEFLKIVVEESNKRLERVWKKIKRLEKLV
jgi:tRNA wybutosine-synthesizing protein 3